MKNKRKYSCDKFLYSKRASNQGARPQSLQLDYLPTRGYGRIMHVEREITVLIMAKLTQATDTAYRFYFNELF